MSSCPSRYGGKDRGSFLFHKEDHELCWAQQTQHFLHSSRSLDFSRSISESKPMRERKGRTILRVFNARPSASNEKQAVRWLTHVEDLAFAKPGNAGPAELSGPVGKPVQLQ